VAGVRLQSVKSDHVPGHDVTISGGAPSGQTVGIHVYDPVNGSRQAGSATADSSGTWTFDFPHGFLFNTVIEAVSNGQASNIVNLGERQVLHVLRVTFHSHDSHGYHFTVTGTSTSRVPNERISVLNGHTVVGVGTLRSNGGFSINFVVPKASTTLTLLSSGSNANRSNDPQYVLPGTTTFTAKS
jgi:hypothetical protein